MRIALTALTPRGPADVIVSGDDGATAGQVAEALAAAFVPKEQLASVIMHPRAAAAGARLAAHGPVLWAGGQQVPPDTPAARALRDGAVVTTLEGASSATSLAEPGGVAELRVIGGPDAGTVHRLGPGVTTLGSGPGCQVRLTSPGVPAHAATVTVAWGLSVPSLDPGGPALLLDGKPVTQACAWPFGSVLRVSTTVLQLMRPEAPDAHLMRVGLFDGPALIQLVPATKDVKPPAVPTSFCVPVSMSLTNLGVVGLAGPVDASRALARWMVAQAAVLHSPRDLSIVVLVADPAAGPHWNWVRWLPHCAPRGGEDCIALVGADPDSAAKRVTELVAEATARLARIPAGHEPGGLGGGAPAEAVASNDLGPKIIVVLDGARQL